jgi:hypothetical protein
VSKWHRPGDLPVDRAREVARTCWEALRRVDPEAAQLIADVAAAAGETWLTPQISQYALDDTVPVLEAAELVVRSVRWVYQWVAADRPRRAVVGTDGRIQVRVRDILESVARERRAPPTGGDSAGGT